MKLRNELTQKQQLILTPRMEQSLLCLQLPFVELEDYVMNEAQENPLIDFESLTRLPVRDDEFFDRISPSHESFKEHLVQLVELSDLSEDVKELCFELVYHLDSRGLLSVPLSKLAKEIGVSLQLLLAARDVLRELSPPGTASESEEECFSLRGEEVYPSAGFYEEESTIYVEPDIVISECGGKLKFDIRRVDVRFSQYYLDLMKSGDAASKKFLKKMKKKADALIYALEKREETLTAIAEILIDLNREYFLLKADRVRRLSVSELARRIGRNKSTASRSVSGKYVLSPRGLYPLSFFFGDAGLRAEALFRISQILREDPKLTDREIVEKLSRLGIDISRRTVNKYRHMLVSSS